MLKIVVTVRSSCLGSSSFRSLIAKAFVKRFFVFDSNDFFTHLRFSLKLVGYPVVEDIPQIFVCFFSAINEAEKQTRGSSARIKVSKRQVKI